ncbi:hypothetical protein TNCV_942891 [Trichonephila clavipes]|nr:hypothetical protein TNCV_942891 [Trichonephila clavipes]
MKLPVWSAQWPSGQCNEKRGWRVTSSSPVSLKTHRVGCSLNLLRVQVSSGWCRTVVRKGGASSGVVLVT